MPIEKRRSIISAHYARQLYDAFIALEGAARLHTVTILLGEGRLLPEQDRTRMTARACWRWDHSERRYGAQRLTGGAVLTIWVHSVRNVAMSKTFTARLGPNWTRDQFLARAERLYWQGYDRQQQIARAYQLDAATEGIPSSQAFMDAIERAEAESGHDSGYEFQTEESLHFWLDWLAKWKAANPPVERKTHDGDPFRLERDKEIRHEWHVYVTRRDSAGPYEVHYTIDDCDYEEDAALAVIALGRANELAEQEVN